LIFSELQFENQNLVNESLKAFSTVPSSFIKSLNLFWLSDCFLKDDLQILINQRLQENCFSSQLKCFNSKQNVANLSKEDG
jgi:hypothetical protein